MKAMLYTTEVVKFPLNYVKKRFCAFSDGVKALFYKGCCIKRPLGQKKGFDPVPAILHRLAKVTRSAERNKPAVKSN